MTEPKDRYQSQSQSMEDLLRDYLADYPMKIYKNAAGEVVKIEITRGAATFVKTFTGHGAGDEPVEVITVTGWEKQP